MASHGVLPHAVRDLDPQFYSGGEFDPAAFGAYLGRVEELGFDSVWAQEQVLGPAPQLSCIVTGTSRRIVRRNAWIAQPDGGNFVTKRNWGGR